jgi:hypothetical protein
MVLRVLPLSRGCCVRYLFVAVAVCGTKTKCSTSFVERKPTLKQNGRMFVLNLPASVFLLHSAVNRWLIASLPIEDDSLPTCLWLVYCSILLTLTAGVLVSGIDESRKQRFSLHYFWLSMISFC